jgi:hypothetical protein
VFVSLPVQAAFELFTAGIGQWWPLLSHSVGKDQAETCIMEGRVGGRIYEVLKDKRQFDWGQVLIWEPPNQVAFTWHPGRQPDTAQHVKVTFHPVDGGARVELVHAGWEALGENAGASWENYDTGWDYVLGKYIARSEQEAGPAA